MTREEIFEIVKRERKQFFKTLNNIQPAVVYYGFNGDEVMLLWNGEKQEIFNSKTTEKEVVEKIRIAIKETLKEYANGKF